MSLIVLIIILAIRFGGGGGYYGCRTWGPSGGIGIVGLVLIVLVLLCLFGGLRLAHWLALQAAAVCCPVHPRPRDQEALPETSAVDVRLGSQPASFLSAA